MFNFDKLAEFEAKENQILRKGLHIGDTPGASVVTEYLIRQITDSEVACKAIPEYLEQRNLIKTGPDGNLIVDLVAVRVAYVAYHLAGAPQTACFLVKVVFDQYTKFPSTMRAMGLLPAEEVAPKPSGNAVFEMYDLIAKNQEQFLEGKITEAVQAGETPQVFVAAPAYPAAEYNAMVAAVDVVNAMAAAVDALPADPAEAAAVLAQIAEENPLTTEEQADLDAMNADLAAQKAASTTTKAGGFKKKK